MKNKALVQVLNLVLFIITAVINVLSTILPIGVADPGTISDSIPNLFVPAGLTFSIWSVIYLLLAIFSVYQMRDIFKKEKIEMPYLEKIGYFFILSSIANITWIFLWQFLFVPYSLIAMLVLLYSLLTIYLRLRIGKEKVSKMEKFAVHLPFSVYLGWITVATIANVTAVLVDTFSVASFGALAEFFTVFVIGVAVVITLAMLLKRKDVGYSLVIIWALLGIYIKQSSLNFVVSTTAIVAMVIVFVGIIFVAVRYFRK